MRKRRVYLVLATLAVAGVVGLIVAGAFWEREPVYGGKRLSEWLENVVNPLRSSPRSIVDEKQTVEAIRGIGTNGIASLLKWIRYETPTWKTKLYPILDRVLRKPRNWSDAHDKPAHRALHYFCFPRAWRGSDHSDPGSESDNE